MQNVVLPAYVYHRTGRASLVGIFIFAQLGPLLLLSIPAGVIADKFDRRKWLIFTQSIQLTFSFLLFPLAAADAHVVWLFMAQLGVGVGNALNAPAWSATLPGLVPPEDLAGAISLNSTIINGSRVIGPIIVDYYIFHGRHYDTSALAELPAWNPVAVLSFAAGIVAAYAYTPSWMASGLWGLLVSMVAYLVLFGGARIFGIRLGYSKVRG